MADVKDRGDRPERAAEPAEVAERAEPAKGGQRAGRADRAGRAGRTGLRDLTTDELAVLEEERDFLLRSLRDLDAEREAGDVDQHDYDALRDDYTARAARVIRSIERHQARQAAEEPRSSRWRRVGVAAGVVAFALLAGVVVAQATGHRQAGESATGDIRETSRQQVDQAIQVAQTGDYDQAVALLDEVLELAPDNVEALTYKGWFQYRAGDGGDGVDSLTEAVQADATFPATHAFLAVILAQNGRPDLAREELDRLDALDPPAMMLELVEPLRQELEAGTAPDADDDAEAPAPG